MNNLYEIKVFNEKKNLLFLFLFTIFLSPSFAIISTNTVVLVVADDLGAGDLGYTGSGIKTPNIDALAASGTILKNYYVQRACTPTRAALLTGRYPIRYGFQSGVLKPAKPYGLPLNEKIIPQYLKSHGFATHAVGKWHLGYFKWSYTPTFRGFDSFYGYYTGGESYFNHRNGNGYDLRFDSSPECGENCSQVLWEANGKYSTHLFTARAIEVIESHPIDKKLFLYLPFQAVHAPSQVPESYSQPYNFPNHQRNVFAGMLTALDEGIGNITIALKAVKRWESTLFIFTSDNGAPTTGCGGTQGGQNFPKRGGKCSAWEGGLNVVSFAHGPKIGITQSKEISNLAHVVDWLPTILAFVNDENQLTRLNTTDYDNSFKLDGLEFREALMGKNQSKPRTEVLLEADPHAYPADGKNWGGDQHATPYYAIRRDRWKLILGDPGQPGILDAFYCTGPPCPNSHNNTANASAAPQLNKSSVQLFDVGGDDPYEVHNVATTYPEIVTDLMARIIKYNNSAVSSAQQGLPNDPAQNPKNHNGTIAPWIDLTKHQQ